MTKSSIKITKLTALLLSQHPNQHEKLFFLPIPFGFSSINHLINHVNIIGLSLKWIVRDSTPKFYFVWSSVWIPMFFCVPQKKESHTGLEQMEGE